jgi:hypothetical protein
MSNERNLHLQLYLWDFKFFISSKIVSRVRFVPRIFL